MTYNMGTGGWPESIEHWTSKEELFRLLRRKQRRQEPFGLFYVEDCPRCEGGGYVENILWDVVRVEMEATSHGFRPDILLRRTDGTEVWLEIVATSTPPMLNWQFANGLG